MTRQSQTQEEQFYVKNFLTAIGVDAKSVGAGPNPPDFILSLPQGCVAVEVTEFHSAATGASGYPRRLIEEESRRIQDLFTRTRSQYPTLDDINGMWLLKRIEVPSRGEQQEFVNELLRFGSSIRGSLTREGINFTSFGPEFPLLDKYLKRLRLSVAGCYITWESPTLTAAAVGLTEPELLEIIFPKLQISRLQNAAENWLLVASGPNLSQSMGLPNVEKLEEYQGLNDHLRHGPYDKVYLYQYMFGQVLVWQRQSGWTEIVGAKFAGARSDD